MELVRHQNEQFVFVMSAQEKLLLLSLLSLFPLTPLAHPRRQLSRLAEMPDARENQQLLAESLKAQQEHSRQWVAGLHVPECFKPAPGGFQLTLNRAEVEELLQVLNDVRIGSWLALGAPDTEAEEELRLTEQTSAHGHRLQLAGLFEMFFLKAIGRADT